MSDGKDPAPAAAEAPLRTDPGESDHASRLIRHAQCFKTSKTGSSHKIQGILSHHETWLPATATGRSF